MSWSWKEQLGACERLVFGTSCQGNRLVFGTSGQGKRLVFGTSGQGKRLAVLAH